MKDEIKEEKKDEKLERKKLKRRERAEKRQHKHMGISLRWFVTFLIIVLCAGIMLVYSLMSSRLYVQRYQEQLKKNVMAQAEYLKNNLLENHMTLDDPQDLNLRIEGVATTFYGRVLVINREYRVIKDTYGNHENAQIVNPDIMAVMRGQASEKISKKDGYLEYITAVKQAEILTDANGAAVGVKATGSTGETITVNAKAVVLTTGGFGANLDMVTEYKPELKGFMTTNAAGAQGQGIEMATAVGADTVDMDQIQIHPTVEANTAALITEGLRGDGAVLINAEGKRFIDEVGTRDVVSAAEIAQTGSYSWLVVDQAMVDASSVIQGYIKKGYTVTGQTYEELAKAMGVDEAAFAETMKTWNGYVEAKNDPDFGRTSFAKALDTAPYYAIKVTAGVHHTMGGLKINTNTEVLKADGSVIPGLFAAGEVTGGVHGANRLGGNAVADFTVFGRIAGAAASKYAA